MGTIPGVNELVFLAGVAAGLAVGAFVYTQGERLGSVLAARYF